MTKTSAERLVVTKADDSRIPEQLKQETNTLKAVVIDVSTVKPLAEGAKVFVQYTVNGETKKLTAMIIDRSTGEVSYTMTEDTTSDDYIPDGTIVRFVLEEPEKTPMVSDEFIVVDRNKPQKPTLTREPKAAADKNTLGFGNIDQDVTRSRLP